MVAKFCAYFITGRYRVSGRAYRHSRTLRPEPILALEFSPDGKWLVSIGENSIRIFSVRRAVSPRSIFSMYDKPYHTLVTAASHHGASVQNNAFKRS